MNVLLVAEESAGIQVLRLLSRSEHRIVAALTAPQTRGGGATVASVARALDVPVLPSESVRDPALANWIREQDVEVLLNIYSLFVVDGLVVAAPSIGSFNLHPGPLPCYAGLSAPSWAIYHGERRHAVTLHWMQAGIDTGPIAHEAWFDIDADDTGLSLSARCVRAGLPLVERLLADASNGADHIPTVEQDLTRRRYFPKGAPDGGRIRWSSTARQIVDLVRASDYFPFPSPWGQPRFRVAGREVGIAKATITRTLAAVPPGTIGRVETGRAEVAAGDEWIEVRRLMVDGEAMGPESLLHSGETLQDG